VSKPKKHILTVDQVYDFEMIGICSHHNDYRLAWSLNEQLGIHLSKSEEDYLVSGKKGSSPSGHSMYLFKDQENLIEYYMIKNKSLGKFLIPEKPTIDYFLFIYENHLLDPDDLVDSLKDVPSVLGAYVFNPEEIDSTENIVFN
jgi:hypothetical protein